MPVRTLVSGFTLANDEYDTLILAVKNHIQPRKSIVMERYKFFLANQLENESIPQYVVRLKQLSANCEFDNATVDSVTNQLVRDKLITGLRSKVMTEKLLEMGDVPLASAVNSATGIEKAYADLSK